MSRILDSGWTIAAAFTAAAGITAYALAENRQHWRGQPGKPAELVDGRPPRLGPPTKHCVGNRHWKCDGRSRVGSSTVFQCGCTCHMPSLD